MTLRFAYNTNGAAFHRLDDAMDLMADAGYAGVALTLDHQHFDPFDSDWTARAEDLRCRLDRRGFGSVVETGARFLLDPRSKHAPTLLNPSAEGRARRVAFLQRAIDIGGILGSEAVSFWAGVPQAGLDRGIAASWLREGLARVADYANRYGVVAALEPEPGMLVETVDDYRHVAEQTLGLRLALDLGHLLVTGEREPPAAIREFAAELGTVTIEDMRRGVHIHLPFGEGDMDTAAALSALTGIGFEGLVCVELSRDGHQADRLIPDTLAYLRRCEAAERPTA